MLSVQIPLSLRPLRHTFAYTYVLIICSKKKRVHTPHTNNTLTHTYRETYVGWDREQTHVSENDKHQIINILDFVV